MVIPHKDEQKQTKLAIDTWSTREIAVTAKASKIKLQAGHEEFRQSKSDKPQS